MKCLTFVAAALLLARASHAEEADASCDRILTSMSNGCKEIRHSLISPSSMDPKVVCCTNLRYNVCVQSVNGYGTIAKATRICPAAIYDATMVDLNGNIAMAGVKALCEKFDTQTCITEPLGNAWSSVKNTIQENTNVDIDKLGEQIGKNYQAAMSQIGTFANRIQDSIAKQDIPGRFREGASAITNSFQERTKQLGDMVSGQGVNRYSVVDADGKSQDSLSLDSIINSVVPDVEIVEKKADQPGQATASAPEGKLPAKRQFSFSDWFSSLTGGSSNIQPTGGSSDPTQKPVEIAHRRNPYSIN